MITDNDAVTLQQFDRRTARVEAMRLDYLEDLVIARRWGEKYGLQSHIAGGRVLILWRDPDVLVSASLGQWLTFTPATGAFEVYDDDEFRTAHNAVTE